MIKLKHLILESIKFRDDGGIEIPSPDLISDAQWAKVAKFIFQKGYNIRDADDAKNSVTKFLQRNNGVLIPDGEYKSDWISAIKLALGAVKKTSSSKPDSKKHFSKAKRYFGTTNSLKLAGYILPDGALLNLSADGYDRNRDHRDITHVFQNAGMEVPSEYGSGTPYMRAFMEMGAVRINGDHGQVDIATPLTGYQEQILGVLFARNDGEIDLDVTDKDYGRDARQYAKGTSPERILRDIGIFYRTGSLPKRSEFREIRLSELLKKKVKGLK